MSSLSEKMISEFVESTTSAKEERSHEFTIYGTVQSVDNNGVANVLLDGGEVAPCQTTVGCSANDRVIVSFKNREPVVTSNISSPTTSVAQLNAEVANINTVVAQKATITQLNTEVANINTVMAQKATITYVDTKTVNAVNVFAQNGTFSGTLSAARGTFSGTVDITWKDTSTYSTTHVVIGQNSYKTKNGYPGIIIYENGEQGGYTVIAGRETTYYSTNPSNCDTYIDGLGVVARNGGNNVIMNGSGVTASNGSRLISSSEISTLSNLAGWINRGAFTGNLNSTTITPGFYRVGSSDSYSGTKPSPAPSWCLFFQSPAYNTQVFIDASDKFIAFRDYTGSPAAWGSWRKLTAT